MHITHKGLKTLDWGEIAHTPPQTTGEIIHTIITVRRRQIFLKGEVCGVQKRDAHHQTDSHSRAYDVWLMHWLSSFFSRIGARKRRRHRLYIMPGARDALQHVWRTERAPRLWIITNKQGGGGGWGANRRFDRSSRPRYALRWWERKNRVKSLLPYVRRSRRWTASWGSSCPPPRPPRSAACCRFSPGRLNPLLMHAEIIKVWRERYSFNCKGIYLSAQSRHRDAVGWGCCAPPSRAVGNVGISGIGAQEGGRCSRGGVHSGLMSSVEVLHNEQTCCCSNEMLEYTNQHSGHIYLLLLLLLLFYI